MKTLLLHNVKNKSAFFCYQNPSLASDRQPEVNNQLHWPSDSD